MEWNWEVYVGHGRGFEWQVKMRRSFWHRIAFHLSSHWNDIQKRTHHSCHRMKNITVKLAPSKDSRISFLSRKIKFCHKNSNKMIKWKQEEGILNVIFLLPFLSLCSSRDDGRNEEAEIQNIHTHRCEAHDENTSYIPPTYTTVIALLFLCWLSEKFCYANSFFFFPSD